MWEEIRKEMMKIYSYQTRKKTREKRKYQKYFTANFRQILFSIRIKKTFPTEEF